MRLDTGAESCDTSHVSRSVEPRRVRKGREMIHVNRNGMSAVAQTAKFIEGGLIVQLLGSAGLGPAASRVR
jgi:hypothetical protein